jgi:predicted Fe-Mo cluster-binding NifX family protein
MIKRVAFASSDGNFIDYHFGRANIFFVYDIGSPPIDGPMFPALVEKRRCYRIPGQGGVEQGIAHHREELERVGELLKDCDAIFVAKIGMTPAKFFIEKGIRVFQLEARIDEVIEEIVKENETELRGHG